MSSIKLLQKKIIKKKIKNRFHACEYDCKPMFVTQCNATYFSGSDLREREIRVMRGNERKEEGSSLLRGCIEKKL